MTDPLAAEGGGGAQDSVPERPPRLADSSQRGDPQILMAFAPTDEERKRLVDAYVRQLPSPIMTMKCLALHWEITSETALQRCRDWVIPLAESRPGSRKGYTCRWEDVLAAYDRVAAVPVGEPEPTVAPPRRARQLKTSRPRPKELADIPAPPGPRYGEDAVL